MTRVNKQAKEYFAAKVVEAKREQEGRDILDSLVLPCMPKTLEDCYKVTYLSFGYEGPLDKVRIDFWKKPEAKSALAYGTIDKAVAGLTNRGWKITKDPVAELVYKTSTVIQVRLEAHMEVENLHSMMDTIRGILRLRPIPTTLVTLEVRFENLKPTDSCRLVEVEEWVEEKPSVPAHMETKNKLVCDEEEDGDNNADVG